MPLLLHLCFSLSIRKQRTCLAYVINFNLHSEGVDDEGGLDFNEKILK